MFHFMIFTLIIVQNIYNTEGIYNQDRDNKTFLYNRYKYDEFFNVTVNKTVLYYLDFYEESDAWDGYPSRVHVSTDGNVKSDHPLFVTAVQQKGITSWELPLMVTTKTSVLQFDEVSRTLCPHDAGPNITSVYRPSLQLTTSCEQNVTAKVKLRRVQDFFVQVDKELELKVKPSTPKYYYFSFDTTPGNVSAEGKSRFMPRFNYTIPKSVILIIESDDKTCATISIQNNSCPVFDNEKDVLYQGYHLTMTTKGGITLTQSMFPNGFYIMFIVHENDDACNTDAMAKYSAFNDRHKQFRFRIVATISYVEYLVGALVTLALAIVTIIIVIILPHCTRSNSAPLQVVVVNDTEAPSTSGNPGPAGDHSDDDSLLSIPEWEGTLSRPLTVAGLSRATPNAHSRRTDRYFWSSLTVAVVYALPVVQLLITYQRMVFQTGDQDECYYNFLCAHPLGVLSDFNHVLSNVGYVLLGLAFMLQVRHSSNDQETGIPQHRGLQYALGLALAMEGLLSGCYHLCPNKMNFQFDSSFMYVLAVLCMVKLYQSRHADVNAGAHATFMLLAALMAIVLIGIMYASIYFWVAFTILHLGACFVLTLKIYYVGQFKIEYGMFFRGWSAVREHRWRVLSPSYTARAVLLALANLANWALAVYGMYEHNKDFARHLLAILMGNTILYTCFYVVMKLVHRERIPLHSAVYLLAALASWVAATVYFLDARTKWSETPAQSRQHNAQCSVLHFYDSHDVWHLASAAAMFLYLNVLRTIDDHLANTPRDQISVF